MKSIVIAQGVSFEHSNGRELFHSLHFSLGTAITALVGPNGVGKTCLARLLSGQLEPTSGSIRRNAPITYFPQRLEPPARTVEDYLGAEYAFPRSGEKLLEPVDRQALCSQLSGGQWMRVRLARELDERFLILDEPTNDLDRDGREAVLQLIRGHTGGMLLISHDRECLSLCSEVLELSNRGLSKFGGWDAYSEAREHERENLSDALEDAKRERDTAAAHRVEQRDRQDKRNRRAAEAAERGGMPKILLGGRKRRAQATSGKLDVTTADRLQQAVRDAHEAYSEIKVEPVMYADLLGEAIAAQKLVAEARGFNVRFGNWLFERDLDFSWRGNVRVALRGPNGSGKSTLLKAILGETFDVRGELRNGDLASLDLDQRCALLDDERSVFENVREVSSLSDSEIRNGLASFLFAKEAVFQKVRDLSGGERLRAALACGFLSTEKPQLLILDEPTNNLDLVNIEFLENLVRQFPGALVVISHDETFLENCGVTEALTLPSRKCRS